MCGYYIDPVATAYLAEIGEVSRSWAATVLEDERGRANEVRLWMHHVLEEWLGSPTQAADVPCRCLSSKSTRSGPVGACGSSPRG